MRVYTCNHTARLERVECPTLYCHGDRSECLIGWAHTGGLQRLGLSSVCVLAGPGSQWWWTVRLMPSLSLACPFTVVLDRLNGADRQQSPSKCVSDVCMHDLCVCVCVGVGACMRVSVCFNPFINIPLFLHSLPPPHLPPLPPSPPSLPSLPCSGDEPVQPSSHYQALWGHVSGFVHLHHHGTGAARTG